MNKKNFNMYSYNSGNFIKKSGEIVNIADLLKAKAISEKKHDINMYSLNSSIFLNSEGEECDIIDAIENLVKNSSNNIDNETVATGEFSHAEGFGTQATGKYAHAEGVKTKAEGVAAHAEGSYSTAKGTYAHAEGGSTATGSFSHSEGSSSNAKGHYSHAEGYCSQANGDLSHASGHYTKANTLQFVIGKFNEEIAGGGTTSGQTGTAFVLGNGSSAVRSNAFRIDYDGEVYASNSYNSTGTGYSEMYEWSDGNINDEDRRGLFVTLESDKIRVANSGDNYILGVVSSNSALICNTSSEAWAYKYEKDVFGSVMTEIVESENLEDENGIVLNQENKSEKMILNDLYNEKLNYVPRNQRSEWAAICLVGKVVVIDDGTCEVNSYCKSNENGIATKSDTGYRVVERIDENHIKIILK